MAEYIDRNALIEHIRKDPLFDLVEQYGITGVIESFPAADVQPVKHGRWIEYPECLQYENAFSSDHIVCSCCEAVFNVLDNCTECFVCCPNCGARMDGET